MIPILKKRRAGTFRFQKDMYVFIRQEKLQIQLQEKLQDTECLQ